MIKRFKLGQIVNAVGLKGETKVYPYTDYKERFCELDRLYIEDQIFEIEKVRFMGQIAVIKFKGVNDRNAAEALKGSFLYIDRKDARKLEEGEYFIPDLIGIRVLDEEGTVLGILKEVYQNGYQDVYEIACEESAEGSSSRKKVKTFLIPAVGEFILNVDVENREMTVRTIEGMR